MNDAVLGVDARKADVTGVAGGGELAGVELSLKIRRRGGNGFAGLLDFLGECALGSLTVLQFKVAPAEAKMDGRPVVASVPEAEHVPCGVACAGSRHYLGGIAIDSKACPCAAVGADGGCPRGIPVKDDKN